MNSCVDCSKYKNNCGGSRNGFAPKLGCFKSKAEADKGHAVLSNSTALLSGQREFKMMIETHTPKDPGNVCKECVLSHGLMCLDRSYCEFPKTGKTWRKST